MTLSFEVEKDGSPTYVIEKIWEGIFPQIEGNKSEQYLEYQESFLHRFLKYWDGTGDCWHEPVNPKYHAIRYERWNYWMPGKLIHFLINNRKPTRFQFAPVVPCVSLQKIAILKYQSGLRQVKIDGRLLEDYEVERLAKYEGYDSKEQLLSQYKRCFYGIIIHWTALKY